MPVKLICFIDAKRYKHYKDNEGDYYDDDDHRR